MSKPRQGARGQENVTPLVSDADLDAIILRGDPEKTVACAERIGRDLANQKLSTSQIRALFGETRKIEMRWPRDAAGEAEAEAAYRRLLLLKPKLRYQAARAGRDAPVRALADVLDPAIDRVQRDRRRFQYFFEFFEAILAYHRAYGGG